MKIDSLKLTAMIKSMLDQLPEYLPLEGYTDREKQNLLASFFLDQEFQAVFFKNLFFLQPECTKEDLEDWLKENRMDAPQQIDRTELDRVEDSLVFDLANDFKCTSGEAIVLLAKALDSGEAAESIWNFVRSLETYEELGFDTSSLTGRKKNKD